MRPEVGMQSTSGEISTYSSKLVTVWSKEAWSVITHQAVTMGDIEYFDH